VKNRTRPKGGGTDTRISSGRGKNGEGLRRPEAGEGGVSEIRHNLSTRR